MYAAIKEVFDSRELLLALSYRDIKIRYKQTMIGAGWAILMPLLMMVIFTTVFAKGRHDTAPIPYQVFVFCGLLPWQFFSASLKGAVESLSRNNRIITKIYFPREVFPMSQVLASSVDFLVGAAVLVLLMIYFQTPVTWTVIALPLVLAVQVLFTLGLAFIFSVANLFYRDVKYVLDFLLLPWMLATSVIYPIKQIDGVMGMILKLNPMTPIINAYRQVLLEGQLPLGPDFLYAIVVSVALAVFGFKFFHESEHMFAEII